MTEHLGQMAACQQQLMHGLQEYLGLDVSGVDVAATRQTLKKGEPKKTVTFRGASCGDIRGITAI